jgi:hypothetical protein
MPRPGVRPTADLRAGPVPAGHLPGDSRPAARRRDPDAALRRSASRAPVAPYSIDEGFLETADWAVTSVRRSRVRLVTGRSSPPWQFTRESRPGARGIREYRWHRGLCRRSLRRLCAAGLDVAIAAPDHGRAGAVLRRGVPAPLPAPGTLTRRGPGPGHDALPTLPPGSAGSDRRGSRPHLRHGTGAG